MQIATTKYTRFLLIILFVVVWSSAVAQQSRAVVISEVNPTIEQVFRSIEKQTGLRFVYDASFDTSPIVNPPRVSTDLSEMLTLILQQTGYTFLIRDRFVGIIKLPPVEIPTNTAVKRHKPPVIVAKPQTVYGILKDKESNRRISGANVELFGDTVTETISDAQGRFRFERVGHGTYMIVASQRAYQVNHTELTISKNQPVNLSISMERVVDDGNKMAQGDVLESVVDVDILQPEIGIVPYNFDRVVLRKASPVMSVRTNLLYNALTSFNLGVEFKIAERISIDVPVSFNAYDFSKDGIKKSRHLLIQPEVRFWNELYNRHFIGAHLIYASYNIGGYRLPLGIMPTVRENRYEGDLYGLGISYGYHLRISNKIRMEFTLGLGYVYNKYERYTCRDCSKYVDRGENHYFGPTKAGISLVYMIK